MGKTFAGCLLAFALVGATMAQRPGRRQRPRGGRDGQGYAAPPADTGYAAPSDDQPSYQDQDVYQGAASDAISSDNNLAMLEKSVPGVPGEDYPIYSEVPETGFGCEGQVDGGYYADPEAECQVFHICANDGAGGRSQYSFLCPNGTLFQQPYFVCDWWFNVDCSLAEQFYSLNDEIAAERAANSPEGAGGDEYQGGAGGRGGTGGRGGAGGRRGGSSGAQGAASSPRGSYSSPSGGFGGSQGFGAD